MTSGDPSVLLLFSIIRGGLDGMLVGDNPAYGFCIFIDIIFYLYIIDTNSNTYCIR